VPIIYTERFQGRSKMTGHIIREALWMVWRLLLQNKLRRRPRKNDRKDLTAKNAKNS
jgi:dolichol-phosphate mannosyltransferase